MSDVKAIPDMVKQNFDQVVIAFARSEAYLLSTTRKDGSPAYLICAVNKVEGESVTLVPFAELIQENPFDLYNPPDPDDFTDDEAEGEDLLSDAQMHELDHQRGEVDPRVCQGLGCPYGDVNA